MSSNATFSTFNPLSNQEGNGAIGSASDDLSNGNTKFNVTNGSSGMATTIATPPSGGKWYCEFYISGSVGNYAWVGYYPVKETPEVKEQWAPSGNTTWVDTAIVSVHSMGRYFYTENQYTDSGATSFTAGDVISIALDLDNGATYFAKNGTYMNSGNPASGSSKTGAAPVEGAYSKEYLMAVGSAGSSGHAWTINSGQDSTFGGNVSAGGNTDANGFGDFKYTVPSGYLALCSANVPVSDDINPAGDNGTNENPTKQFNAIVWTGNRSNNSTVNNITGVGFQPDLVWLKILNNTYDHRLVDSSRGVTEAIRSNKTTAEQTEANGLYQFGSDGFSVKGDNNYNSNGDPFIGYCWRANGGTTASNSDGDITSTVQANTNAGFSIVTYTGDNTDHRGVGYGSANIGHGLDSAPEFIITKRRNASASWYVLHASAGVGYLTLNSSLAFQSGAVPFGPALPTTTTFGAYSANNISGATYINYCWHSVEGYSKFGLFEGNADNNGPFIYTGFRPRLLFIKNMDSSSAWGVYDGERPGFNDSDLGAWDETTGYNNNIGTYPCDILSNGFKLKTSNSTVNSSHTWVYGAWGDVPFKYNNTF